MGARRFAKAKMRTKRKEQLPPDLSPEAPTTNEYCPCKLRNPHKMHAPPDWSQLLCCGKPVEPVSTVMRRYGRCRKCRVLYWSNPWNNDRLEPVSTAGREELTRVLLIGA